MSDAMYDVRPEQYPTVIREMIRHENDVTNHRIMWLLIGQGFIANAFVNVKFEAALTVSILSVVGILISLSAYLMLYRSYQARGYLQFLGELAKAGTLKEMDLPLLGWPKSRLKGWWKGDWACRWIRQARDLFEPWLLLPYFFNTMWIFGLLRAQTKLNVADISVVGAVSAGALILLSTLFLVWTQSQDE